MTSYPLATDGWASYVANRAEPDEFEAAPDLDLAATFYDDPTVGDGGDAFLRRLSQLKANGRANRVEPADAGIGESAHLTRQRDKTRVFLAEATLTLKALPRFVLTNTTVGLGVFLAAQYVEIENAPLAVAATAVVLSSLKDTGEHVTAEKAAMQERPIPNLNPSYDPGDS